MLAACVLYANVSELDLVHTMRVVKDALLHYAITLGPAVWIM